MNMLLGGSGVMPVHLASYRGKRQRKGIAERMEWCKRGSEGLRVLREERREGYSGKTGEEPLTQISRGSYDQAVLFNGAVQCAPPVILGVLVGLHPF